ncbi:MAG: helix-turn-helix transcriptional regulator [Bacillota bacterium]|nr:helix-turn-helix transcriptional regulator [Bacillota bacterium]
MIEPALVVFTILMLILMAAVAVLAAIFAAGKNTQINRSMRNLSLMLLFYMIFAFLQHYFQQNLLGEVPVKLSGCIADICYFSLVAGWLRIVYEFAGNAKAGTIKRIFTITVIYGLMAELIVILAGEYDVTTAELFIGDILWRTALMVINGRYAVFILVLGIKQMVLSFRGDKKKYEKKGVLSFGGLLALYMLWNLVFDYDVVYNTGRNLTEGIVVDPIFVVYCLLDLAVIYFFFKKDPLTLLSRQSEQERTERLRQFAGKNGLTRREEEVLELVCLGRNNPDIADELFISEHTVKRHLNNIFQKTGVKNRYELISDVLKI